MAEEHSVAPNHVDAPAVTMVAAWMSADTGVGPSIASGSQTFARGIWADLPVAPTNSSSVMSEIVPKVVSGPERRDRPRDLLKIDRPESHHDKQHAEDEARHHRCD